MSMEMWPREVSEEARKKIEAALEAALEEERLRPSEEKLMRIYGLWARKSPWTVQEAAALVMGADPSIIAAYEFLPSKYREEFDRVAGLIRREFPAAEIVPADLRERAPTVGLANSLLWSAIDLYNPATQKAIRRSDETRKDNTKDKLLFALALHNGFRSANPVRTAAKVKRVLDKVGVPIDEATVACRLDDLAKDPKLRKLEAQYLKENV
jgi:hypothetical protein